MELKKLSHRHEEVLMWLLLNPDKSQRDCARELNFTEGWLSQIISSDLFQIRLAELREQDFNVSVLSLREKLTAVANLSLEKQLEKLELENDFDKIQKAGDSALKRLGYGIGKQEGPQAPAQPGVVINNQTLVLSETNRDSLQAARNLLEVHKRLTPPLTSEDDQARDETGRVINRGAALESTATRIQGEPEAT